MKTKGMYQVSRYPSREAGGYEILNITAAPDLPAYSSDKLTLVWQRNFNGDLGGRWYGVRIDSMISSIEDLAKVAKLAKVAGLNKDLTPEDCIANLQKAGYVQAGYHSHSYRYYPLTEWPTGSYFAAADAEGKTLEHGFARDEDEAKRLFAAKAAESLAQDGYSCDLWVNWLQSGRPVFLQGDPVPAPEVSLATA